MNWQDISTAPKDGTEVLCWREDCGPFIAKYTSVDSFPLTQAEIDAMDEESLFHKDWFTQWPQAFRLDGSEAPTHWMPLPAAPGEKCRTCSGHGAVGNILTAEPCPDCTPAAAAAESFEDLMSDWAHGDALDAARYRWLRDNATRSGVNIDIGAGVEISETLDAAVDDAMRLTAAKESP